MKKSPKISVIVCTHNSPGLIRKCLESILEQKFEGGIEILIIEGGSNAKTVKILKKYEKDNKNLRIIKNPKKLPEGEGKGKWLGWREAKGEFVAIIDQDNELQGKECLNELLKPFSDKSIFGSLARLKVNSKDNLTNQYIALQGTDPFFAYKSLDGIINLKREKLENEKEYFTCKINPKNPIITGGNCFVYKKKYLDLVGGYIQDTENILNLAKKGYLKVAIPKKAFTHHRAIRGFLEFIQKKKKWAKTYEKAPSKEGINYLPKNSIQRKEFLLNFIYIFFIFPNVLISFKKIFRTRKKAWIMHSPLTFITGIIYFFYAFLKN